MRIVDLAVLATVLPLASCASMNKQCFEDGACRTEKNGVVTWEGPPEAVAKRQAKENAEKQLIAEADKAYAEAPRRAAGEPIRLVLVGPSSSNAELESFTAQYRGMLEQALRDDARIQLVPYDKVKTVIEGGSSNSAFAHSSFGHSRPLTLDEATMRRLRDGNAEVDVVVVAQFAPKKVSGFVGGGKGNGVGVAEVNNVEFTTTLSSVYKFDERTHSEIGKSTDSLNVAGVKDGKKSAVELKGKRNPEQDRPAVNDCGNWVKSTIATEIAPNLPGLAAVAEIRAKLNSRLAEIGPMKN